MNRTLLGLSLLLAVLADYLLWGQQPGPGWFILVLFSLGATGWLARLFERRLPGWSFFLWTSALLFSLAPLLYQAHLVQLLAPPLCLTALSLAVFHSLASRSRWECLASRLPWGLSATKEYCQALTSLPMPGRIQGRVVLLALPMWMVFGALFVLADPAYASWIGQLTGSWQPGLAAAFRIGLWTSLVAALCYQARSVSGEPALKGGRSDGHVWSQVIHSLNLLFFSFLVCQGRYLFSQRPPSGLTLAEYARHGFFELLTATLLVVALILWNHNAVAGSEGAPRARKANALLLILTSGLLFSSAWRMQLYIEHFGLTLTRAYVLTTLAGIAATLALCLWALIQDKSPLWLRGRLLGLSLISLALASLINVEGWVARVNLSRPEVDYVYLQGLSSDIAPWLDLGHPVQAQILLELRQRHGNSQDWRSWTWSGWRVADR